MSENLRRSDRIRSLQQEGNNAAGPAGNNAHSRRGSTDSQAAGPNNGSPFGPNAGSRRSSNSPQVAPAGSAQQPHPNQVARMGDNAGFGQGSRRPSLGSGVAIPSREHSLAPVRPPDQPRRRDDPSPPYQANGRPGQGPAYGLPSPSVGRGQPIQNAPARVHPQGPPSQGLIAQYGGGGQMNQPRPQPGEQGAIRHSNRPDDPYWVLSGEEDNGNDSDELTVLSQNVIRPQRPARSQLPDPVPFPGFGGSRRSSLSRWEQAERTIQNNVSRNNQRVGVHNMTMQIIRNINREFFTFADENQLRQVLYGPIHKQVTAALENGWIPYDVLGRWANGGGPDNGGPGLGGPGRGGGGSAGGAGGGSRMVAA